LAPTLELLLLGRHFLLRVQVLQFLVQVAFSLRLLVKLNKLVFHLFLFVHSQQVSLCFESSLAFFQSFLLVCLIALLLFKCFLSLQPLLPEHFLHRAVICWFSFSLVLKVVDGVKLAKFALGLLERVCVYFEVALASPNCWQPKTA
jgi:hypothetical protein